MANPVKSPLPAVETPLLFFDKISLEWANPVILNSCCFNNDGDFTSFKLMKSPI